MDFENKYENTTEANPAKVARHLKPMLEEWTGDVVRSCGVNSICFAALDWTWDIWLKEGNFSIETASESDMAYIKSFVSRAVLLALGDEPVVVLTEPYHIKCDIIDF